MGKHIVTAVLAAALVLGGCAGRDPNPVAVVQPGDASLDCAAIQAEVLANNKTVQGLASDEGGKVAQNVTAGVVGLFIWPLWFAMDFKGAASKEEAALQSRQRYLAVLAAQKHYGGGGAVPAVASLTLPSPLAAPAVAAVPASGASPQ